MAEIVLRSVKGVPLTNAEVDANFNNLNTEVGTKLNSASYTAADVLTKLKTVDGAGSGLDADLLDGKNLTSANTPDTVVQRDANGDFAAGTLTVTKVIGAVQGNVTGNVTGDVSGNAANVTGVVAITNGGTGATSAGTARTALGVGTLGTQNSNSVNITGGTIATLTTDLAIADGGTGASTAAQARTNLGLQIGNDIQAFDPDLTALAALSSSGMIVRTGAATAAARTVTGEGSNITVENGDGVAGNPTIKAGSNIPLKNTANDYTAYNRFMVTSTVKVPVGTTAQRGAGAQGDFRFNNQLNQFEGFNGTAWGSVGGGATGAPGNAVFVENDQIVTGDYTITSTKNAMSAGPITIADGVTVTIPDGVTWTIV